MDFQGLILHATKFPIVFVHPFILKVQVSEKPQFEIHDLTNPCVFKYKCKLLEY